MSKIVFDDYEWWRQPGWQIAAAGLMSLVALVVWWAALSPVDEGPIVARTPAAPTVMAQSVQAPITPTAPTVPAPAVASRAAASALPMPAPLSTMVAPGVHITPLGLPPGAMPPSGPQAEENLDN